MVHRQQLSTDLHCYPRPSKAAVALQTGSLLPKCSLTLCLAVRSKQCLRQYPDRTSRLPFQPLLRPRSNPVVQHHSRAFRFPPSRQHFSSQGSLLSASQISPREPRCPSSRRCPAHSHCQTCPYCSRYECESRQTLRSGSVLLIPHQHCQSLPARVAATLRIFRR